MIKKILESLPNAYENHYTKEHQYVDGYCPDIIVKNQDGKIGVHEVEVIKNKPYSENVKRVLWIAMQGKGTWDEVHLITDDGTYYDLEPLEIRCLILRREISELTDKRQELENKKRDLENKIKMLESEIKDLGKALKSLYLAKARTVATIRRVRSNLDYDPIWERHLLEELRKEVARFECKKG
jgi:predicted RNase H-like nuclease (RuvC/YqgF family)